jgi:translation elongation factor EF-Ts
VHNGRIETYVHSDSTTRNKGAAVVKVTCQTDFAARTVIFIAFCETVARYAYAAQSESWPEVVKAYPDLEIQQAGVANALNETIYVSEIKLFTL